MLMILESFGSWGRAGSWSPARRAAETRRYRFTSQPRAENVLDVEHSHGGPAVVDHGHFVDALFAEDPESVGDEPLRTDDRGVFRHDGTDTLLLSLRVAAEQAPQVAVGENSREAAVAAHDAHGPGP